MKKESEIGRILIPIERLMEGMEGGSFKVIGSLPNKFGRDIISNSLLISWSQAVKVLNISTSTLNHIQKQPGNQCSQWTAVWKNQTTKPHELSYSVIFCTNCSFKVVFNSSSKLRTSLFSRFKYSLLASHPIASRHLVGIERKCRV